MTEPDFIRRLPWRSWSGKIDRKIDTMVDEALSAPWRFDTPVTSYILCNKHEFVLWLERPVYKSPLTGWKCGTCYEDPRMPKRSK